jgi:hypothetical protein
MNIARSTGNSKRDTKNSRAGSTNIDGQQQGVHGMKVNEIIDAMGGRAHVRMLTGVTRGMIHLMVTNANIAPHHIRFFIALRPELDWPVLLDADLDQFADLLADKRLVSVRNARRRKRANPDAVAELQ